MNTRAGHGRDYDQRNAATKGLCGQTVAETTIANDAGYYSRQMRARIGRHTAAYDNCHYEALFRIQRGLIGHVSYLASADANTIFTEYLLYEPILRILVTLGYAVSSEVMCEHRKPEEKEGETPKLDFEAKHPTAGNFALEVKWPRWSEKKTREERDHVIKFGNPPPGLRLPKLAAAQDILKLTKYAKIPGNHSFLCIFGRNTHIDGRWKGTLTDFVEPLEQLAGQFNRTWFTCRILQYVPKAGNAPLGPA